ncbi:MAG: UPF0175 family protein [Gammaproteobacteria bacterium]|nr:UPF0175 family protein [Gammaproteobacteria bacterium]MBU1654757.1 UPF0175 family protein [Gammaproteobacteria bacterium]MBU1961632.1 UPF0175 family protein [Gammaproteobacteria bacterium]
MAHQLIIDIPEDVEIPDSLQDPPLLRQAIAMTMYHIGRIDLKQAIGFMGGSRQLFEEKMMEFGIPMMGPEEYQRERDAGQDNPS